ncbi:hypothetical protein TrispH2_003928 [Trichoplax sp. H2]|nr:hypothetical protein TrispH2_003928 [Trichoplax sp. H2]|eukprot:RDD43731.1 hypothetical protein TrispH2_003928 [Trichoplax sp. H2]
MISQDTSRSEDSTIRSRKKLNNVQNFKDQRDGKQDVVYGEKMQLQCAVEDYRLDLLRIVLMVLIFFILHWLFGRFIWNSDQSDIDKSAILEKAKEKVCPKGYDCSYNLKSNDELNYN